MKKYDYNAIAKNSQEEAKKKTFRSDNSYNETKSKPRINRFVNSNVKTLLNSHDKEVKDLNSELLKERKAIVTQIDEYLESKNQELVIYRFNVLNGIIVDKYFEKMLTILTKIDAKLDLIKIQRKVDKEERDSLLRSKFRVDNLRFFEKTVYQGFELFIVNQILWSPFHNYRDFIKKSSTEIMELVNEVVLALLTKKDEFMNIMMEEDFQIKKVYKFIGSELRRTLDLFVMNSNSIFAVNEFTMRETRGLRSKVNKIMQNGRLSTTQKMLTYLQRKLYNQQMSENKLTSIEEVDSQSVSETVTHRPSKVFKLNDKGELTINRDLSDIKVAKKIYRTVENSLTILTFRERLERKIDNKVLLNSQTSSIFVDIPLVKICQDKYQYLYNREVLKLTKRETAKKMGVSEKTVYNMVQEELYSFRKLYDNLLNTKVYDYEFSGLRNKLKSNFVNLYKPECKEIDIEFEEWLKVDNPFSELDN